eukprot:343150_1
MSDLSWSFIASLVYFSFNVLLLVIIAIHTHIQGDHQNAKDFFKAIWNTKSIYGQLLIHLYDTATDFGVLVQWYSLAYNDINYESIDMLGLFWTAIGFLIAYRLLSTCLGWCLYVDDDSTIDNPSRATCILYSCLGFWDMIIFQVIYASLKKQKKEPTQYQKLVQLFEAIFESMPQVILQSFFIIIKIANKFTWIDKDCVVEEAKDSNLSRKIPFINAWYVLRVIWRFSFVTLRFCVLGLIWSALGGAFLGIFVVISYIHWCLALMYYFKVLDDEEPDEIYKNGTASIVAVSLMYGIVCLISTPASESILFAISHAVEMISIMVVITIFATNESIVCELCADEHQRQLSQNPFIKLFIFIAWISMAIDAVSYFLMLYYRRVESGGTGGALRAFQFAYFDD